MERQLFVWIVVVLLVGAFLSPGGGVGRTSAGHDPENANSTIEPFDRSPGATDVKYGMTIVSKAGVDLETLTRTLATYSAGSWEGCGPSTSEVFGIDRGNTHGGYEIDEELTDNVKSYSAGEDELDTRYYREGDFGGSTYYNEGDELVTLMECVDNPDGPGWYRIGGRFEGVTAGGTEVSYSGRSHYFWICNCEDESAAREELGPPPSEPTPTPTPTVTVSETQVKSDTHGSPVQATRNGTGGSNTPTATRTRTEYSDTPTATRMPTAGPTSTPTPPVTPAESWERVVVRTPTVGSGAGFGGPVALGALIGAALLVHHRS